MRPLWMIDSDQSSHTVNDQFSIGDEIIVAPILEQGRRERDVSNISTARVLVGFVFKFSKHCSNI